MDVEVLLSSSRANNLQAEGMDERLIPSYFARDLISVAYYTRVQLHFLTSSSDYDAFLIKRARDGGNALW